MPNPAKSWYVPCKNDTNIPKSMNVQEIMICNHCAIQRHKE